MKVKQVMELEVSVPFLLLLNETVFSSLVGHCVSCITADKVSVYIKSDKL